MSKEIAKNSKVLSNTWKWKDNENNFHDPKTMETRHLFYTLRMIWNHSMPEDAKLRPYNAYHFGPFYTVEYMTTAVNILFKELLSRKDITKQYLIELEFMKNYFKQKEQNTTILLSHNKALS